MQRCRDKGCEVLPPGGGWGGICDSLQVLNKFKFSCSFALFACFVSSLRLPTCSLCIDMIITNYMLNFGPKTIRSRTNTFDWTAVTHRSTLNGPQRYWIGIQWTLMNLKMQTLLSAVRHTSSRLRMVSTLLSPVFLSLTVTHSLLF